MIFLFICVGCGSKAEVIFVVDCSASLGDENFKLQQGFLKQIVGCMHVGDSNIRVGFVPYNTEVFECFGLDLYATREDVMKAIGKIFSIVLGMLFQP